MRCMFDIYTYLHRHKGFLSEIEKINQTGFPELGYVYIC